MVKNTRRQYLQLCQLYDGFCNLLMFLYCLLFRTCFRIVYLNDNFILAIDHRFGRFLQVYISCIKFVFGCFWRGKSCVFAKKFPVVGRNSCRMCCGSMSV